MSVLKCRYIDLMSCDLCLQPYNQDMVRVYASITEVPLTCSSRMRIVDKPARASSKFSKTLSHIMLKMAEENRRHTEKATSRQVAIDLEASARQAEINEQYLKEKSETLIMNSSEEWQERTGRWLDSQNSHKSCSTHSGNLNAH